LYKILADPFEMNDEQSQNQNLLSSRLDGARNAKAPADPDQE